MDEDRKREEREAEVRKRVMQEKFKSNLPKNVRPESPPSGFTKFFSAIFMCGVDDKGKKGAGCCAGPGEDSADEKETKYDIQPSQSVAGSELLDAMEKRKKKRKMQVAPATQDVDSDSDDSSSKSSQRSSSSSDGFKKKSAVPQQRRKKKRANSSSSSGSSESDIELKQFKFLKKEVKPRPVPTSRQSSRIRTSGVDDSGLATASGLKRQASGKAQGQGSTFLKSSSVVSSSKKSKKKVTIIENQSQTESEPADSDSD